MTKSVAGLFGAFALTITAAPAQQQDMDSANFMMPGCRAFLDQRSQGDIFLQGECVGTVSAITVVAGMTNLSLKRFPLPANDVRWKLCIDEPNGVTVGQEVRVVVSYIDAHPARMHETFVGLAFEAVRTAWPCR